MSERESGLMRSSGRRIVAVTQDNYGRWFVEAKEGERKLAPIRCLTETDARDRAKRVLDAARRFEAA